MEPLFVRGFNNYDVDAVSDATGLKCEDKTLTKQSFAGDADINELVRRFHVTGELPTNVRMPLSGDFTNVMDFRGAMDAIVAARESFDAMPAEVRARFDNDPAKFVDFCDNKENWPEAEKMGLLSPDAVARLAAEKAKAADELAAAAVAKYKESLETAKAKPSA